MISRNEYRGCVKANVLKEDWAAWCTRPDKDTCAGAKGAEQGTDCMPVSA